MIKERLHKLEHDIKEGSSPLPQYYRINTLRNAPHMFYEQRVDGKRYGLTMKLKEEALLEKELGFYQVKKFTILLIKYVAKVNLANQKLRDYWLKKR